MEGFIPIRRSLFNHFLYKEDRVFSRFEAWLDLIQMATFQDENTRMIKGKVIICQKGQLVASVRFLEQRWKWSRHKVCDYLELLRSQDMLSVDNENGVSRITLINFKKHNDLDFLEEEGDSKRDSKRRNGKGFGKNKGTQKGNEEGTPAGQSGDSGGTNTNKDNNDNKGNENPAAAGTLSLEDRFKNFQDWISKNAPQVAKLRDPFTKDQYESIRTQYPIEVITEVLVAMHNRRSLLKDYVSAYLTCLQWLKIRQVQPNNKQGLNGSKTEQQQTTNIPKAAEVLSKYD